MEIIVREEERIREEEKFIKDTYTDKNELKYLLKRVEKRRWKLLKNMKQVEEERLRQEKKEKLTTGERNKFWNHSYNDQSEQEVSFEVKKHRMLEYEKFEKFENLRKSGLYNMIIHANRIIEFYGFTRGEYFDIINNYSILHDKYSEENKEPIYVMFSPIGNFGEIDSNKEIIMRESLSLPDKFRTIKDLIWGKGGINNPDHNTPWSLLRGILTIAGKCHSDSTDEFFLKSPNIHNMRDAIVWSL